MKYIFPLNFSRNKYKELLNIYITEAKEVFSYLCKEFNVFDIFENKIIDILLDSDKGFKNKPISSSIIYTDHTFQISFNPYLIEYNIKRKEELYDIYKTIENATKNAAAHEISHVIADMRGMNHIDNKLHKDMWQETYLKVRSRYTNVPLKIRDNGLSTNFSSRDNIEFRTILDIIDGDDKILGST